MARYGSHDDPNDEEISLLSCLFDLAEPPKHNRPLCETNNCPRCEYDVYKEQLEKHREQVAKDRDAQDQKDFEEWKAAGRPKAGGGKS